MAVLTIVLLPLVGSVMLAWGIFQVVMDLRTAKQRKVVDRLTESGNSRRDREIKQTLLSKRAANLQNGFLEGLVSRLQMVRKIQCVLDQADLEWSASRMLVNLAAATLLMVVVTMLLQFGPATVL
ncbi:MAG TPA: hypothetical protein VLM89_07525, partial [Phycisphaerae bacterium]|nr:hypothetical protein [Phycisphaerae bacterium]